MKPTLERHRALNPRIIDYLKGDAMPVKKLPAAPNAGTATPPADPWAHRSAGMRCASCMWFVPKKGAVVDLGRCRRHAPTITGYPVVFSSDWCGDHKLDENKA
ncbi:MAG: hypothetical protein IT181_13110 [Acidobacteria bacterium]|nr:hypothetical protein [Acidobacteriota bacterium]